MNVLNQISELKGQLQYANNVLNAGGLQQWEAKEYSSLAIRYEEEIIRLQKHVEENKEVFFA